MMLDSHQNLFDNIERYVSLSEGEKYELCKIIKIKKVNKKQCIIRPGHVCDARYYIVKGAFKVYYLDEDAKEHTVSIGIEDWFVSDFYSYISQTPALLNAEALENSVVLALP